MALWRAIFSSCPKKWVTRYAERITDNSRISEVFHKQEYGSGTIIPLTEKPHNYLIMFKFFTNPKGNTDSK